MNDREEKRREKKEKRNKTSDSILVFLVIASLMIVAINTIISGVDLDNFKWIIGMIFVLSIFLALFTK